MSLDFELLENYCEHCRRGDEVMWKNITHNLTKMAAEAGIYTALWHPEEEGWKYAKDIIPALEYGIKKMIKSPAKFKKFNPSNGWGSYDGLLKFAEEVLDKCKEYPNAAIKTCT